MIPRLLSETVYKISRKMPVVAVIGPRQSGKTTLVRTVFKNYTYLSLEDYDIREAARIDPRGFLLRYADSEGIILDEFQHVPQILSYIQTLVDEKKRNGYFILTGSQNFLVNEAISQTLAGRIAIVTLLPLSIVELSQAHYLAPTIEGAVFKGSYPRIYDEGLDAEWYSWYIQTYLERDVRSLDYVGDLSLFKKFMQLCAGRIGQILNMTSLANDLGISLAQVKKWLSVLEASYIIFLVQPYHTNFNKRLVKSPKLYFYDTGLACSLLDIDSEKSLFSHYARGALVESYIISDLAKQYYTMLKDPRMYFWRDNNGHELDVVLERGQLVVPIEIKAGYTVQPDFFKGLYFWQKITKKETRGYLIYSGEHEYNRFSLEIINWKTAGLLVSKITSEEK